MTNYNPIISGINVDAVYINNKYQDETKQLNLKCEDIQYHQFMVDISTIDGVEIQIGFHSLQDLLKFSEAYKLG